MTRDRINPSRRKLIQGTGLLLGGAATGLLGLPQGALAARAATRNTDTVRLTWGPSGALSLLAKERGVFEKTLAAQGIKAEWIGPFPNHAPTLQAVVGGSADFAFYGSTTPALAAILAGSPLVFVQYNVQHPRSTAILVKKNSGIDTVHDLVGKKIAVNRSGLGEFLVVAALEKNGLSRDQVQFVYLNPPDAAPAFGQGKVDAWSMWSPGVDIAREQFGGKDIFFEGADLPFYIDFGTLVSSRKFVTENSALVRAVIDAYAAEGKWANENLLESEIIAQKAGKYSDGVRDHLVGLKRLHRFYEADDAQFLGDFQRAADWLSERKVLPKHARVAEYSIRP
ncbi:NrtA/SsuA/CpmA family ABC transporter substrate-binding protein [Pseudothauera rhizosphaerae]|uniref:Putative aliphatic sulfonates-binding protein n=1 Tax=Pseudothauera rhizosphaerae TaxID=2565932 RepID=A0A4S4AQT1_9RHOO|nr:NrtA/SsuA/CpmA family ABC transporter substrate-binding protein [Pseudothauera rhizosphaerae]THF62121.1 aliphatic sulfonate ABC transporter substrate-binding protein [Pseudothauera rhizosphaerae]